MRTLPTPKPGDPILAAHAAEHLRGTQAALNWSIDGMDLNQSADGQRLLARPRQPIQLVKIVSPWQHVPPGQDQELLPTAWHYCEAVILQRGLGQAEAWAPAVPEQRIRLWAPTAYPGQFRDTFRGKQDAPKHLAPELYREGDWVWAIYHYQSGLWLLLGDYDRFRLGSVVSDKWYEAEGAEVSIGTTAESNPVVVSAYDMFNVISTLPSAKVETEDQLRKGKRYIERDHLVLLQLLYDSTVAQRRWILHMAEGGGPRVYTTFGKILDWNQVDRPPWIYAVQPVEWRDGDWQPAEYPPGPHAAFNAYELAIDTWHRKELRIGDLPPVLPIPYGAIVRTYYFQRYPGDPGVCWFSAPNQYGGPNRECQIVTGVSWDPPYLRIYEEKWLFVRGHYRHGEHYKVHEYYIQTQPQQPGLIQVGGNIIPGDPVGRFFRWPGLWNGMPQWRHGQNPNWWIRWVPLPNNPQQGRWVIGWWPNDAQQGQQPQRGWGQQPPAEGQPPNQNPIDEFPDPIGDVQGTPQTITADYLIQDCIHTQSYVELVNSGQFVWPVGQVIKWADAEGNVHCGKVADLPVEGTKVQNWRLISLEKSCQACGVDVVVADCNLPQKKYRLQGSGSLGLQPGQVIVWVENPGGGVWEELHCGTVQARSDIFTHDASPEAWAFGKIISSCQQCPSGECPSEPSCPSYPSNPPCPEYCPCIEVIGQIQPAEALGVYTLQGVWNEHCWWKKDNWAVYYVPATTKWYIVNLQNSQQYWWRHGNGPFGGYRPRDTGETTGIAVIVGK